MMTEVNIKETLRGINYFEIRLEYIVKAQNAYNRYKDKMKAIIDISYVDEHGILCRTNVNEKNLKEEASLYYRHYEECAKIVGMCNTLIELHDNKVTKCKFTDNEMVLIGKIIQIGKETQ